MFFTALALVVIFAFLGCWLVAALINLTFR